MGGKDDDDEALLKKHLSRFDSVSKVKALAEKLFQKEPDLFRDLEEHLEHRVPSGSKPYLLHESRAFVARVILTAIRDHRAHRDKPPKLPKNLEAYLAYMDLCWMGGGTSQRTHHPWHTFKLQGFQSEPLLSSVPLYSFRRRFKEYLPSTDHVFSVQTDIGSDSGNDSDPVGGDPRILFRVVLQKSSRKARRDQKLLLRKTPTFFVYYPGEPYLYVDKPALDPVILEAICGCFLATKCTLIPLSGTHLESLRQFRLLRDGNHYRSEDARPPCDVLDLLPGDRDPTTKDQEKKPLPKIQELRIACDETFLGTEELKKASLHRKRPLLVTDLHFEVHFQGPDVLAGLQKMASLASSSSPTNPAFPKPDLLPLVLKRGRNKFSLKRRRRNDGENLEITDSIVEADQMSTLGSEMTLA